MRESSEKGVLSWASRSPEAPRPRAPTPHGANGLAGLRGKLAKRRETRHPSVVICPTCHSLLDEGLACEGCSSTGNGADTSAPTEGGAPERSGLDAERAFLFDAARRALAFARVYRSEEGRGGGARERACLVEVANLRALLSRARERARAVPSSRPSLTGPGLKKSRELEVSAERDAVRRGRAG
jgi:hypothetical protein